MKNHTLRKTILAALGTAALAASTESAAAPYHEIDSALQAGAVTCFAHPGDPVMSFHDCNFGSLTGTMRAVDRSAGYSHSFTSTIYKNQGFFHGANFYRFSVGTADELAAGKRYKVTITMRGRKATANETNFRGPLQYPSFTVWAMGSNPFRYPDSTCYSWSQLRGPNDDVDNPLSETPGKLPDGEVVTANNTDSMDTGGLGDGDAINPTPNGIRDGCLLYVGVVDGHDGWVGYAYSGPDTTTVLDGDRLTGEPQTASGQPITDALPRGWFVNHQSPFVDGAAASGKVVWDRKFNRAKLVLRGVKPGGYLIGAGGGCATVGGTPGAWTSACSQPQTGDAYTMTIATQPEAE